MNRIHNDDPRVVDVLRSSTVVRTIGGMLQGLWTAGAASVSAQVVARGGRRWRSESAADRRRAIGLTMVMAAVTHLGLLVTQDTPPGWLWLALPALAMMVGSLCVLVAAEESER